MAAQCCNDQLRRRHRCRRCRPCLVRMAVSARARQFTPAAIAHHDNRSGFGKLVISFGSVGGRPSEAVYLRGMPWNGLAGKHG
jgi:hypothetical protein